MEDDNKVYFQFWNDETQEYECLYMELEDFLAMTQAEEEARQEIEDRRKEADRLERDAWLYARDD